MRTLRQFNPRLIGTVLLGVLGLVMAASASAAPAAGTHSAHMAANASLTTPGWYKGDTVTFYYPKSFFCAQPPTSAAASGCEVGEEAASAPRGGDVPVLYVMTPIGFRPDESTLQCPVVGACINHPSTIDLSRVFGSGAAELPLPAHSHIVDERRGGWWEIEVIGVTDPAVWDQVVAGKSLARVRELQMQGAGITGDIPSNLFLFFNVMP